MSDFTSFKNKIFLYAVAVMMIFEILSLPFLGIDIKYGYGLLLGTAVSIANFNILGFSLKRVLNGGNKVILFFSYLLRLAIYGVAMLTAFSVSNVAALGSVLGFITVKISIYYLHGFKAKFSTDRKVRPEVQEQFEREDLEKELKKEGKRDSFSEEE